VAAVSTSCSFCKENSVFYTKKISFVKKCKFSLHMMISICNYLNIGQYSPALAVTARRYNFVSVTRRSIRAEFCHPRQRGKKTVTVRGEYGAVFAVRVQTLWTIRVSRYKSDRKQVSSQGILSFIAGTGAIAV